MESQKVSVTEHVYVCAASLFRPLIASGFELLLRHLYVRSLINPSCFLLWVSLEPGMLETEGVGPALRSVLPTGKENRSRRGLLELTLG